jgi:hypothetical protein
VVGSINLWAPSHVSGLAVLVTAFLLGIVHGVTPDEHTWPITFSYAVGSYSSRRGLRTGLTFSLAFTFQRALTAELAYLGLARLFTIASLDNAIYVVVGVLMTVGGVLILGRGHPIHAHLTAMARHRHAGADPQSPPAWLNDPRPWMPAVHGFVAGWGFGAFAIIIYTVLAPAMHSAALGWVPGALFGLGTTAVQALGGASFGWFMSRRGLTPAALRQVALVTAARTLKWGGVAFVAAGLFGLTFPRLAGASLTTGVRVHNLDTIGLPLALVILTVLGVGGGTLVTQVRARGRRGTKELAGPTPTR